MFSKPLPFTTRGEHVFEMLKLFIEENGLDWLKLVCVCTLIVRRLVLFATTYRCERGPSTLIILKTELRNRLNVEHDLRCKLSK